MAADTQAGRQKGGVETVANRRPLTPPKEDSCAWFEQIIPGGNAPKLVLFKMNGDRGLYTNSPHLPMLTTNLKS